MKYFHPYKGRNVAPGQRVQVYRNLNKGPDIVFSIRDAKTGLVLGHATHLTLSTCEFVVREAGRAKVLKNKRKFVHAWIEGHFGIIHAGDHEAWRFGTRARYNPYKNESFILEVFGADKPIYSAGHVYIEPESGVNVGGYQV